MSLTEGLYKGMVIRHEGQLFTVLDFRVAQTGKQKPTVHLKLRSVSTGHTGERTLDQLGKIEEVQTEMRHVQYLYADDEQFHFMDLETYDQFAMPMKGHEDKKLFILEGETVQLSFWDEKPIDILLPYKVALTVREAGEGLRGDTVSGATKPVTVETGLVVKVPLFIKQGDKILVNSETRDYVERVNE